MRKLFGFFSALLAVTSFAQPALAGEPLSARYACDGSKGGDFVSVVQYQVGYILAAIALNDNDHSTRITVQGRNEFPEGMEAGRAIYGTPPFADLKLEIVQPLDAEGRFTAKLVRTRGEEPRLLSCRML